jgi:hypothetical protein
VIYLITTMLGEDGKVLDRPAEIDRIEMEPGPGLMEALERRDDLIARGTSCSVERVRDGIRETQMPNGMWLPEVYGINEAEDER